MQDNLSILQWFFSSSKCIKNNIYKRKQNYELKIKYKLRFYLQNNTVSKSKSHLFLTTLFKLQKAMGLKKIQELNLF